MNQSNGSVNVTVSCNLQFDSTDFKAVAAVRASVGFVSFVACVLVVGLIVLFKKYKFFTQRLILYLAIAAMLHSLSYTLARVNYYTPRPIEEPYCYFGGFFNHYTAIVELVHIWCISFNVFVNAFFRKRTTKLEYVYVSLPWLFPWTYIWVLLWKRAYAAEGPFCSIKFINADCTPFPPGYWLVFGTWYIPLYTSLGIIFIMFIAIGLKVWLDAHKWHGKYDPETLIKKRMLKDEVKPLVWYPIIYMALNVFSLISQIYNAAHPDDPQPVLWYMRALTSPIRGAFIALVYALDKETRTHLKFVNIKAAFLEHFRTSRVQEYDTPYHALDGDSLTVNSYSKALEKVPADNED